VTSLGTAHQERGDPARGADEEQRHDEQRGDEHDPCERRAERRVVVQPVDHAFGGSAGVSDGIPGTPSDPNVAARKS
jgi:hypothetical protein